MNPSLLYSLIEVITQKSFTKADIFDGVSLDEIYQSISGINTREIVTKHLVFLCDLDFIRGDDEGYYYPTSLAYSALLKKDQTNFLDLIQRCALQLKLLDSNNDYYDDETDESYDDSTDGC
jgi:hypothetical protein